MPIPAHYRRLYISFLRLAGAMIFFALVTGILFQESTRKVPIGKVLDPGIHWESVYHLALVHGHVFLIGVLIPVAVLGMLHFSLMVGGKEIKPKTLKWAARLYHIGVGLTVLLMLYKGYHYVLSVRMGQLAFEAIDHSYFGGSHILRAIVYTIAHVSMSVGLGIIAAGVLRGLPKTRDAEA